MSKKIHKIIGFIDHHEAYKPGVGPDRLLFVRENGENEANATLIIGGKAFTEEEVKAMLVEIHQHEHLFVNARTAVARIAAKHGITDL